MATPGMRAQPDLLAHMPAAWWALLSEKTQTFAEETLVPRLTAALEGATPVFPPYPDWFAALTGLAPEAVRVVIVGQDPYHGAGEAHGLAFSVRDGVPLPPSLRNILKELAADMGQSRQSSDLSDWQAQGVLLLNTALTVAADDANSHAKLGWQPVIDDWLSALSQRARPPVFVLWGNSAKKKRKLLADTCLLVEAAHPSPLGAYKGFFGSKCFSRVNALLQAQGLPPIAWAG